ASRGRASSPVVVVLGDQVVDDFGCRIAENVDTETPASAAAADPVMRDRVVLDQRRTEDAVDAGAAVAHVVVCDDVAANGRRRAKDRDTAASERIGVPAS